MASFMENLGGAFGQASTGVWGLGLLVYAATAAMFASLFVGEFGTLFKTGGFGLHILLAFILGAILSAMALLKRMGVAGPVSNIGQQTQDTADQIRQMVQDALNNATNQSGQPQPDMSAFEDQLTRMQEAIDALQSNMGQYAAGTPGTGAINTNTGAMANMLAQILARLGNLGNLNGQTTPTPQQSADMQKVLRLLQELKDTADDTNIKVGEVREMVEALKEQVSKVSKDVANIDTTLSAAVKKLIDLSGQVTTFEKKSEEWNREVKKSVESVGGALDALTKDLNTFWKGQKGGMITMGRVLQRFNDMSGFIRRLEKGMQDANLDIKGIDAHLQAFDEILEGFARARGAQLSDEQVPDESVKRDVADITVKTAMIGANIAVLAELLTQKVGAVTAQKIAEITIAELEKEFTAKKLKTFREKLYSISARLNSSKENKNLAEINKPIILEALESIRKNYLSSLNETIAFMKKYDALFLRYMKQSAEVAPRKRKPVEYRDMIKAYQDLEKAMQATLNALEAPKGSKFRGAIDILKVKISKDEEDYGGVIKKQFADACPKVEEAIKNFELWRQYQDDFRQKVEVLHTKLSERARETYRAQRAARTPQTPSLTT